MSDSSFAAGATMGMHGGGTATGGANQPGGHVDARVDGGVASLPLPEGASRDDGELRRIDASPPPGVAWRGCLPERIPAGRWPADVGEPGTLGGQFAVNEVMARLRDTPGLLVVDGLPGTGKTALLRDLIAAVIVERAGRLAGLTEPAEAFGPPARGDGARHAIAGVNSLVTGGEIVVASAGDRAAERIAAQLSGPGGIDPAWRAAAARLDYFGAAARLCYGTGAWAMIATVLDGTADRQTFAERSWPCVHERPDGCPGDPPGQGTDDGAAWGEACGAFRGAQRTVTALAAERMRAAHAVSLLPVLRGEASTAFDAVKATEGRLRALAEQRVATQRSLGTALFEYHAAARVLDAHARAAPGPRGLLTTGLAARREWRDRRTLLENALRDRAGSADAARRVAGAARDRFAAAVRERAEAVAVLRRLTAECATAVETIARGRERWGERFPPGPESFGHHGGAGPDGGWGRAAPWADEEFTAARTELFLAALALHKALITARSHRVEENMSALADFLRGTGGPGNRVPLAAWRALFLAVPVVSTTFAALPALFGGRAPESVGWLLIDSAGHPPPRLAVGAVRHAKRTVVITEPSGPASGNGRSR